MSNKKDLSERDICTQFILPALVKSGWDVEKQVREEVFFTDGRIFVKGNKTARGKRKRADFILYLKPNIPIAVIEAKDNNHSVGDGLQQALGYAEILDVPVAFSSNGDGFVQHDRSGFEIKKIHTLGVVGQDNISLEQCRDIIFPIPCFTEQEEILKRVDNLMTMIDELEKQVSERKEQSEMLMQSVLREAFAE